MKQGDPLTGYIYVMCLDGLHCLLSKPSEFGVRIPRCTLVSDNGDVSLSGDFASDVIEEVIASLGYADDTVILSETINGLHVLHTVVKEFFDTHHLVLNSSKTVAFAWNFSNLDAFSLFYCWFANSGIQRSTMFPVFWSSL